MHHSEECKVHEVHQNLIQRSFITIVSGRCLRFRVWGLVPRSGKRLILSLGVSSTGDKTRMCVWRQVSLPGGRSMNLHW